MGTLRLSEHFHFYLAGARRDAGGGSHGGTTQAAMAAAPDYPEGLPIRAFLARVLKAVNAAYDASLQPPPQPNFSAPASTAPGTVAAPVDEAFRGQLQSVLGPHGCRSSVELTSGRRVDRG